MSNNTACRLWAPDKADFIKKTNTLDTSVYFVSSGPPWKAIWTPHTTCQMWSSPLLITTLILSSGETYSECSTCFFFWLLMDCYRSSIRTVFWRDASNDSNFVDNKRHSPVLKDFRPWRWHPSQYHWQGDGLPLQHGWGERTGPPHEQPLQQHYQQWKPVQPYAWVRASVMKSTAWQRGPEWNITPANISLLLGWFLSYLPAVGISQLIYPEYWKLIRCHGLIVWAAWIPCKDACGLCPLLCVLQVWLRFAHIQGLRWVPGRLSVLTVYAGHRHRRLPASAPHRRQRRELPSVKPPRPAPPLVTLVDPNPGFRPFRSTHRLQGRRHTPYVVRKLLKSPTHYLFFSVLPIIINKNGWHIFISPCYTKVKPKYLIRSH